VDCLLRRYGPVFDDLEGVEKHMREIYSPFGDL
jgi:hypothetical protein